MADELNILTPTPLPTPGERLRVGTPHQATLVQLAHLLDWPEVHHQRASGFRVHIACACRGGVRPSPYDRERAWVRFALDGRRKDQFAVLSLLAELAEANETEHLVPVPPPPYLEVARPGEQLSLVPHRFTRVDGSLSGRRLVPEDGYGLTGTVPVEQFTGDREVTSGVH